MFSTFIVPRVRWRRKLTAGNTLSQQTYRGTSAEVSGWRKTEFASSAFGTMMYCKI